jgi:rhodanese-related sulfurtransferase
VLDDAYIPYLKDNRIKVLYSENSIDANQVRLLLTQYGYENLMVLQGGANYWKENMVSKDVFKSKGMYDDEQLNFDPEKLKAED